MGDLKSPWDEQGKVPFPTPGLDGDGITARGGDPNVDLAGSGAVKDFWPDKDQITPDPDGKETSNSVSGMPTTPARWEPTDTPPSPPDLTDRNPGTIDKR